VQVMDTCPATWGACKDGPHRCVLPEGHDGRRCVCKTCLAWCSTARDPKPLRRLPRGELRATCWCESSTVGITRAELLRGLTRSCGARSCKQMHAEFTARRERTSEQAAPGRP